MKEEKKEYIAEVLGEIGDEYIAEAAVSMGRMVKFRWKHWMTAAALCACLLIAVLLVWDLPFSPADVGKTGEDAQTETDGKGVTIPKMQVNLGKNSEETPDMLAFVVYQNSVYVQNDGIIQDSVLLGDRLGHATGMIDEWTPDDGYVEFAGSVEGDIYSVEGFDDSFAVALLQDEEDGDDSMILLVKNNGITLEKGSDLYEKRLHLAGNYNYVQYQAGYAWYVEIEKEKKVLDESFEDKISALVDALNEGTVMLREDVWKTLELPNDMEFVLYFRLRNNVVIPLYIMKGGYVIYPGMPDVCVKIPESVQKAFREIPDSSLEGGKGSQAEGDGGNGTAGEIGNTGGNGNAGKGGRTEDNGNMGGKNGTKTDDQANADGQTDGKGKEEQAETEDICPIKEVFELEQGKKSTVCLYARPDYSRPYIVIREGKTEQKISLGNSKDLWYHDLQHSEIVAEHDFDGDGTKDILVLLRDGSYGSLSVFRMLKRDAGGNWKVFNLPEQMGRESLSGSYSYIAIKVGDDSTVQLSVPATGFKTELDMSKHPGLAAYFAEHGIKTPVYEHFVSIEWYGTELVIVYHISARNAGDEIGTINQKVLWDNEKSCFVLGETWYQETKWEYLTAKAWEGE